MTRMIDISFCQTIALKSTVRTNRFATMTRTSTCVLKYSFRITRWQHPKLYLFHISAQFSALCKQAKHFSQYSSVIYTEIPFSHTPGFCLLLSNSPFPLLWPSLDSISRTNSPHPAQTADHRQHPQAIRVRPVVSLW